MPGPMKMTGLLRSAGGRKAPPLRRKICSRAQANQMFGLACSECSGANACPVSSDTMDAGGGHPLQYPGAADIEFKVCYPMQMSGSCPPAVAECRLMP